MFGRNKKDTANVQKTVAAAASFEVTIGELARKSERRAWFVAFASLLMSLALAGGYYYMLPLKEKVPYVVMADPFSGTASVAALRDDPFYRSMVANETLARANVANYVTARESFDSELLKARDWTQVNVMSSADQRRAFASILAEDNPSSPAKFVRANRALRVQISSIAGIYEAGRMTGATVRIQRNLYDRTSGELQPIDRRLITLTFIYNPRLNLNERHRWLNPLGFVVTQYRSDLDLTPTGPGNLDAAFNAAIESASTLLGERDVALEALKAEARAAAAAADGGVVPAADSGSELPPAPDLSPVEAPSQPPSDAGSGTLTPATAQPPNGVPAP